MQPTDRPTADDTSLYDVQPEPGQDAILTSGLWCYRASRALHLARRSRSISNEELAKAFQVAGRSLADGDEQQPGVWASLFSLTLGNLILRRVNRLLDHDGERAVKAVEAAGTEGEGQAMAKLLSMLARDYAGPSTETRLPAGNAGSSHEPAI